MSQSPTSLRSSSPQSFRSRSSSARGMVPLRYRQSNASTGSLTGSDECFQSAPTSPATDGFGCPSPVFTPKPLFLSKTSITSPRASIVSARSFVRPRSPIVKMSEQRPNSPALLSLDIDALLAECSPPESPSLATNLADQPRPSLGPTLLLPGDSACDPERTPRPSCRTSFPSRSRSTSATSQHADELSVRLKAVSDPPHAGSVLAFPAPPSRTPHSTPLAPTRNLPAPPTPAKDVHIKTNSEISLLLPSPRIQSYARSHNHSVSSSSSSSVSGSSEADSFRWSASSSSSTAMTSPTSSQMGSSGDLAWMRPGRGRSGSGFSLLSASNAGPACAIEDAPAPIAENWQTAEHFSSPVWQSQASATSPAHQIDYLSMPLNSQYRSRTTSSSASTITDSPNPSSAQTTPKAGLSAGHVLKSKKSLASLGKVFRGLKKASNANLRHSAVPHVATC